VEAVLKYPEGVSFNRIAERLKGIISRPTLRKRLEGLEGMGLLVIHEGRRSQKWTIDVLGNLRTYYPVYVEELEDIKRAVLLEVVALATKLRKLPNTKDLCAQALEDAPYVALAFAVFPPEDASEGVERYVAIRALEVLREHYDLILK